jgi:hypothetical protein
VDGGHLHVLDDLREHLDGLDWPMRGEKDREHVGTPEAWRKYI